MSDMANMLERLEQTLKERRSAAPSESYVASLYAKGSRKIAQKVALYL